MTDAFVPSEFVSLVVARPSKQLLMCTFVLQLYRGCACVARGGGGVRPLAGPGDAGRGQCQRARAHSYFARRKASARAPTPTPTAPTNVLFFRPEQEMQVQTPSHR